MKKLLLILFLFAFVNSFAQTKDNHPRVFNVKLFGAKGDGTTNDTRAIQGAINAADAAGGGEVFFPNGIYALTDTIVTASNSQLYIPASAATNTARNHISLIGETRPNYTPVGSGLSVATTTKAVGGVILKSMLTSFSTAGQAILGSPLSGGNFNNTSLSVENMAFQVLNNPSSSGPVIGGINYHNGSNLYVNYVVCYVDTSGFRSSQPVNNVTGIETPDNSSEDDYSIEHTTVLGFRSGYKISEHTVLNQVTAMCCYYGIYVKQSYHSSVSVRAGMYWCAYDLYIAGFCTLTNFQLDTEWQQIGKWYDDVATIKDSSNVAAGLIYYTIVASGVGVDNTKFAKSGGTGIRAYSNAEGVVSAKTGVITGGTMLDGVPAFKVTGTFPTVMTGGNIGADIQITGAGSSSITPSAFRASLLAGYAGPNGCFGVYAQNQAAGTSTNEFSFAQAANYGEYIATTAGTIAGVAGYVSGGNKNYGGFFRAIGTKNSATNIGVAGFAINAGTSPIQIGGYFGLQSSSPTYTSAALIADNGATTSPIFLARDNGTTILSVIDGGGITVAKTDITTGTTGPQTINKAMGSVNFAAAATTLVVTNSLAVATSNIFIQVEGTDATATSARVTKASGSFTITLNAAATAETRVSFWVIN